MRDASQPVLGTPPPTSELQALRLVDDGGQGRMLVALPENSRSVHPVRSRADAVAVQGAAIAIPVSVVHHQQLVLRRVLGRQRSGGRGIAILVVPILVRIVGGLLWQLFVILVQTIGHLDGGTAVLLVVAHLQDALILHRVARAVQSIQLVKIADLAAQLLGPEAATGRGVVEEGAAGGAAIGFSAVPARLPVARWAVRRRGRVQAAIMSGTVQLRLGQAHITATASG